MLKIPIRLTVIRLLCAFAHIRFQLKFRKHAGGLRLNKKIEIFIWSRISKFLRPAQRYDDFKLGIIVRICAHSIPAKISKTRGRITVKQENRNFYMVPYLQIFAPGAAL